MRLIAASLVLGQTISSYQIINDARSQIQFLRVRRKNSGFFEEAQGDDFQRECKDEMCSYEELMEIHKHDDVKAKEDWEKLTRQCYANQCNAQGTKLCVQTWNKRECHCKDGFKTTPESNDCSVDIDECKTELNKCSADQVCINSQGSFTCACAAGYVAGEEDSCVNVDECAEGHECGANADCVDLPGSVTCKCHVGYVQNQETNVCEDDDECAADAVCPVNSECSNTVGSYECVCNDGYSMVDGVCVDIDECAEGADCGLGSCINNEATYTCFCEVGYENEGDPITGKCVDTNECDDENICLAGQTCHNTDGSSVCCDANQDFDSLTSECINRDPCEGVECGDNATCDAGECVCNTGFTRGEAEFMPLKAVGSGDAEEASGSAGTEVDEDMAPVFERPCVSYCHNNPCGEGFDCLNGDNDFTCIDHCISESVSCINGTCAKGVCTCPEAHMNVGGVCIAPLEPTTTEKAPTPAPEMLVTRTCPAGFSFDGVDCSDVDECQMNNGECGSMCMNYYGTRRCYEELNEEHAMCHHSSAKVASVAGYECVCFENYHLCNDGFSCVTNDGYNKYNRQSVFDYTGATPCVSGQFGIDGQCFSVSSEVATYADAVETCENNGGSLANPDSRKVWWIVGNKVQYGEAAFWVDAATSEKLMYVHGDATGALLANPAGNMDNVPPQMNAVPGSEMHFFACQY